MKPSLLLISGWGFPSSAWAPLVDRLGPAWKVRVIGAETILSGWAPDQDPAVRLGRIRSHLPTSSPCILGGWSLGGMLALEAARRLTHLVSGVLLISSTARFCRDDAQDWGVRLSELRAMTAGLRNDPEQTLRQFYAASAEPGSCDPQEADRRVDECLGSLDGLAAGLQYLRYTDLRSQMDCGGLPTVLLHGRKDSIIPMQATRTLGVRLRPSRMELVRDVGHDLPLRHPEIVVRNLESLAAMCE